MEGISDIKIIGIDETRPPRILKEPYINLYFKLSHKAPGEWCKDFNQLSSKKKYPAKIDPVLGLFVETWVRKPEEVELALQVIQETIKTCSEEFVARIQAEARAKANVGGPVGDEGEQGRLNRIVAALNFDV